MKKVNLVPFEIGKTYNTLVLNSFNVKTNDDEIESISIPYAIIGDSVNGSQPPSLPTIPIVITKDEMPKQLGYNTIVPIVISKFNESSSFKIELAK